MRIFLIHIKCCNKPLERRYRSFELLSIDIHRHATLVIHVDDAFIADVNCETEDIKKAHSSVPKTFLD
jgi:hypothetical protein